MQLDCVDCLDGGVSVGIGCQQYAARIGEDLHRFRQEFDAIHLRHAMVGEEQRDRSVTLFQFPQQIRNAST